jgi:invasion protein IalB
MVGAGDEVKRGPRMKAAGPQFAAALAAGVIAVLSAASAQGTKPPDAAKPATAKPAPGKPVAKRTPPAAKPAEAASPTLLGQYGEWGAYWAGNSGNKVCFALAKPVTSQTTPANRPRNPVYLFVASRPAENVKNEVSVVVGYAFRSGTDATVEVGPAKFAMNTQNDGAWIKNVAEEARLVDSMRKASDLTVTGTSSHGTQSLDHYSLKGLNQALDRAGQECSK